MEYPPFFFFRRRTRMHCLDSPHSPLCPVPFPLHPAQTAQRNARLPASFAKGPGAACHPELLLLYALVVLVAASSLALLASVRSAPPLQTKAVQEPREPPKPSRAALLPQPCQRSVTAGSGIPTTTFSRPASSTKSWVRGVSAPPSLPFFLHTHLCTLAFSCRGPSRACYL
jgi:hypothetical protein